MTDTPQLIQITREEWCTALESGKFVQGSGALFNSLSHSPIGYCCLGVAGELAGGVKEAKEGYALRGGLYFPLTDEEAEAGAYLPLSIANMLDLSARHCKILVLKNDRDKWSFDRIAEYIRSGQLDKDVKAEMERDNETNNA